MLQAVVYLRFSVLEVDSVSKELLIVVHCHAISSLHYEAWLLAYLSAKLIWDWALSFILLSTWSADHDSELEGCIRVAVELNLVEEERVVDEIALIDAHVELVTADKGLQAWCSDCRFIASDCTRPTTSIRDDISDIRPPGIGSIGKMHLRQIAIVIISPSV